MKLIVKLSIIILVLFSYMFSADFLNEIGKKNKTDAIILDEIVKSQYQKLFTLQRKSGNANVKGRIFYSGSIPPQLRAHIVISDSMLRDVGSFIPPQSGAGPPPAPLFWAFLGRPLLVCRRADHRQSGGGRRAARS